MNIVYGPVPSRRLGRSLGINNIPPKSCSYSCVYCQVGATREPRIEPQAYYTPDQIFRQVSQHLEKTRNAGEAVDYLTFVPDGEPTLDINLAETIELLHRLEIPVAVISNASLLWQADARAALAGADWVSLKIDSVIESIWKQINRPHQALRLDQVMEGIRRFAEGFAGQLVTETMVISGINDDEESIARVANFIGGIKASCSYLAIPTRPTAESGVHAPDEATLNRCYQLMSTALRHVEYLIGYEGDAFASTGDVQQDLLSITAVHPMRESAVRALLDRAHADWSLVEQLLAERRLKKEEYLGEHYYVMCHPNESAAQHGQQT